MRRIIVDLVIFFVFCSQWSLVISSSTSTEIALELIEWVNKRRNGFFHPKLQVRHRSSDDGLTIFVKERIEEGEILSQIPWTIIIKSDSNIQDEDVPEGNLDCGLVRNLAKELKLDYKSKYAPYIKYLLSVRNGQIPSGWSEAGKLLIHEILGGANQEIPPGSITSMLDDEWFEACNGDENDATSTKAAELVMQRDDNDLMVPLYDLIEHRNGNYTNTKTNLVEKKYHQTIASRPIEPGEQVYKSYDLCEDCNEDAIELGYGTSGKFVLILHPTLPCALTENHGW